MSFVVLISTALAVKAVSIASLHRLIRRHSGSGLSSLLSAWLLVQSITVGWILALSAFGALTRGNAWLCAAGVAAALFAACLFIPAHEPTRPGVATRWSVPTFAASATLLIAAMLALRGLYFYDTTDDALNFGLTRISYWYQNHGVFAQVPARLFEVFAWEWNTDLDALSYFLATGSDHGCAYANIEMWTLFVAAVLFWFETFGGSRRIAWYAALVLATMPVSLSLAMTIKGDIAGWTGSLLGLAWACRALRRDGSRHDLLFAFAAFGFAAGSKVSCAVLAGCCGAILFIHGLRRWPKAWWLHVACIGIVAVNCSRHVVNLAAYGKLLTGVANQPRGLSAGHLAANIRSIASVLFAQGAGLSYYFALFAGTGIVGTLVLAFVIARHRVFAQRVASVRNAPNPWFTAALGASFIGSFVFFAASLPWFPWSFRYYLPWVLPLLMFGFQLLPETSPRSGRLSAAIVPAGLLLAVVLNLSATLRASELFPGPTLCASVATARNSSDLDRKLGRHAATRMPGYGELMTRLAHRESPRVGVLCGEFSVLYPLLGDNASVRVTFAASADDLARQAREQRFDGVIITDESLLPRSVQKQLHELGYVEETDSGGVHVLWSRTPGERPDTT